MKDQVQQLEYVDPSSLDDTTIIKISEPGQVSRLSSNNNFTNQISKVSQKVSDFWERLPGNIVNFYHEYKFLIISFTLLVVVVNALKILLAVTGAINSIPLASTIFELIGLSYVIWIIFRYFLKSNTQQEVVNEIDSLKSQIPEEDAEKGRRGDEI
ncbi:CAAD domain-containing protein [Nostocaceae cyanobacterium CENA369]|uniref:CAAD domain-containing protein n=1 Tax=Dendronalium phyllosphericum CENA369 TaxID=1725256 RepID=A0A8J7LE78_9NOST|nr:CAAD domain-containing protein [Dendronalium phyllosphericum]MBH8572743.1 CAAD domain-containing protein [Dendronalium phyllosphericum CENA369]